MSKKRVVGLKDFKKGPESGGSSSEEDDEKKRGQSYYVGGSENSGQEVVGPPREGPPKIDKDFVASVFQKAKEKGAQSVDPVEGAASSSAPFGGSGVRLGATDNPSPLTPQTREEISVSVQFWADGMSVDEGPLRPYDNPESKGFVDSITNGRIPAELLRLHPGKMIDLQLVNKKGENYKMPPTMLPSRDRLSPQVAECDSTSSFLPVQPADGVEVSSSVTELPSDHLHDQSINILFASRLPGDALNIQGYGSPTTYTIRLLSTRGIVNDSVNVQFSQNHVSVSFKTNNALFLSKNGKGDCDTLFEWESDLYDEILVDQSNYRIDSNGIIEIVFKKKSSGDWPQFSRHPQPIRIPPPPPAPPTLYSSSSSLTNIKLKTRNSNVPFGPQCDQSMAGPSGVMGGQAVGLKPTCSVSPYSGDGGNNVQQGYTGLRNLGNTCFINATVQVLVNTRELREYFNADYYYLDVNRVNPLGMKGQLAMAFAQFIQEMWNGSHCVYEPSTLRCLVSSKATQFANFAQHDAQEFLSFLLDGLHEDLNRIINKPLTERMETDGNTSDKEAAGEAWKRHLLRDDSIIVDLFSGQLKSKLECLSCPKVSYTFDPFTYLTLPFPRKKKQVVFVYWPAVVSDKPKRMSVTVPEDGTFADVHQAIAKLVNVNPKNLMSYEIFSGRIFQQFKLDFHVKSLQHSDIIHVGQVLDSESSGEDVYNIVFLQRLNSKPNIRSLVCAHCDTPPSGNERYISCPVCYDTYYCSDKCLLEHKPDHEQVCVYRVTEKIGMPFFASLPASHIDYGNVCNVIETRAKYSIKIFQPPISSLALEATAVNSEGDAVEAMDITEGLIVDDPKPDNARCNITKSTRTVREVYMNDSQLFKLRWCDKDGETVYPIGNTKGEPINSDDFQLDPSIINYIGVDWVIKAGNVDCLNVENRTEEGGMFRMEFEDLVEGEPMEKDNAAFCRRTDECEIWDLLDRFTETEVLSHDEAWYCSNCKTNREAKKTLNLWKLPPLLIVQLKRFIYSMSWAGRSKNDTKVKYPIHSFDLSNYVCHDADPQSTIYDLYGVVCHSGSSYFGHYISYARLSNLVHSHQTDVGWRKFDDSHIDDIIDEQNVVVDTAYLLFYKRRDAVMPDWLAKYEVHKLDIPAAKERLEASPPTDSCTQLETVHSHMENVHSNMENVHSNMENVHSNMENVHSSMENVHSSMENEPNQQDSMQNDEETVPEDPETRPLSEDVHDLSEGYVC